MDFPAEFKRQIARVERGLDLHVPAATTRPARLHTAMRYSLEAGGKRLRPVLVLAAAELVRPSLPGDAAGDPVPAAVAIECVHTYSLIHDDLPCMDNDDLRRGRPTLAHALTRELADAAGSRRLIGGQMEDLLAEKKADATADELEFIHRNKTAAMIEAALVMGGLVGGAPEPTLAGLRRCGHHLGLAFQIIDDILDATSDSATLGKTAGKDAQAGKTTYVKLHGLDPSRRIAANHTVAAQAALAEIEGDRAFLSALIAQMAGRRN